MPSVPPIVADVILPPPHAAVATEAQKIAQVEQDFEALLIRQMFSSMRRTVEQTKQAAGPGHGDSALAMFNEMLDEQLASNMAQGGGLGLSQQIGAALRFPTQVLGESVDAWVKEEAQHDA